MAAGDIVDSFAVATEKARRLFCLPVGDKSDIVVSVAGFPMDIDLYQAHKALESGKLLNKGGILLPVRSVGTALVCGDFTTYCRASGVRLLPG